MSFRTTLASEGGDPLGSKSSENDASEHSSDDENDVSDDVDDDDGYVEPIEKRVRTLLALSARVEKMAASDEQPGLGSWCTHAQRQRTSRQFTYQVAEAVDSVRQFSYQEAVAAPECAPALARAEQWLESLGVEFSDYMTHDLRLVLIHGDPPQSDKDVERQPVAKRVETVSIPLRHDALMLELSRNRIQSFAKFKPHNDVDVAAEEGGCLSWLRQTEPTPTEDPTIHRLVRVFSRENPDVLIGAIDVAIRLFPSSPANFVFNEYDKGTEGTLSRTEFSAFVRDLSLAGGNLERLEDNIRSPGRNSCVGTLLCLKAPDVDLLSYIGANHSLTMWAFKPDPNLKQDDTAEERLMLTFQLIVWSVAINCVGPAFATLYHDWHRNERPLNALQVYAAIIIADSVGQIVIFVMFKLKHNGVLKRALMVTPDVVVPRCDCSWSFPLRSARVGIECFYKTVLRATYDFSCVRLPVAVAVIVSIALVYCYLRFQLWQYTGSILKTLPSARILEGFKLATIWGLRTSFGAVQGKKLEEDDTSKDENRNVVLDRVDLLETLLPDDMHEKFQVITPMFEEEWKGDAHGMLSAAISSRDATQLSTAIDQAQSMLAGDSYTEENASMTQLSKRELERGIELAKRELVLAKVNSKFGAVVAVCPSKKTRFSPLLSSIKSSDESSGEIEFKNEGGVCSSVAHPTCASFWGCCQALRCCCCHKTADESMTLIPSIDSLESGVEITGNAHQESSGGGTFETSLGSAPGEINVDDQWGIFLMHRDGKWPNGLPDTSFAPNPLSFTNELEVELSLAFDPQGRASKDLLPPPSGDDETVRMSEAEWTLFIKKLSASPKYSFPLNPLKELVYDLNHFDEMRKVAREKDYDYKTLTRRDRFILNTSKKEIQAQIDEVLELGGDASGCFPPRVGM